jgi:hypothetical protein
MQQAIRGFILVLPPVNYFLFPAADEPGKYGVWKNKKNPLLSFRTTRVQ